MPDQASLLQAQLLFVFATILLVAEGVALSVGARWAFPIGIRLRWREETVDLALPVDVAGDLSDPVDRKHAFDLGERQTACWLDASHIGLLDSSVAFGVRRTFRIRVFRGVGVTATGLIQIQRRGSRTVFRWRPVVRLSSPLFLALGAGASFFLFEGMADFPGTSILPIVFGVWSAVYLGTLWWTLRKLPPVYEAVTAQLVAKAAEHQAAARRA